MELKERFYKKEDLERLAEIYLEAFNNEPWNDSWTIEHIKERLSDFTEEKNTIAVVAENENNVVLGAIIGRKERFFDGIHFEILDLFVDRKIKGQGIGKFLISSLEKELKKINIRKVYLRTLNVKEMTGFYERNEFNIESLAIVMAKEY